MGPKGNRLHCTKRHFWVLTWSLCQEGKTSERSRRRGGAVGGISQAFPTFFLLPSRLAGTSSLWDAPASKRPEEDRQHGQVAHWTGQSNTNQLIPFLWKTCSRLMFVTVSVLLLSLCLFTHSLSVIFVVCARVHCVTIRLCGCTVYKCLKRDVRILIWTLRCEVKSQ